MNNSVIQNKQLLKEVIMVYITMLSRLLYGCCDTEVWVQRDGCVKPHPILLQADVGL